MNLKTIAIAKILLFSISVPAQSESVWQRGAPASFGSKAIFENCFSATSLKVKSGEHKPRGRRVKGAYLAPPEVKRPKRSDATLKKSAYGSIRRVDVGKRKLIALGLDIGEQNNDLAGYDGRIIDYLRANKIKATMYVGGKWMATHRERAKQLIADPLFEMGNHAWTHGNFRVLGKQDVEDQIYFTEVLYEQLRDELAQSDCAHKAGGPKLPVRIPTFRFPYGTCNARSLKQVNNAGFPAVQWDIVTGDPSPKQSAGAIARALLRSKPGSIIVAHANGRGWNTAKALKIAIPKLLAKGYEFVTVSELLAAGKPVIVKTCYENRPGDNKRYDRIFGRGTGE